MKKAALKVISEGPVRITRATLDAAWRRRAAGTRIVIRDATQRGLALVVNPGGMTWRFDYKPRGVDPQTGKRWPSQSLTIGSPASHSPEEARDAAGKAKGEVKGGDDPAEQRKASIRARAERKGRTAARMVEAYAEALPKRPSLRGAGKPTPAHLRSELRQLRAAIAAMEAADLPVADLTATHVGKLLASDAGAALKRHRFGSLSRFLDWLAEDGLIAANPCLAIGKARRPKPPRPRTGCLTPAELARLWHAAKALREPVWHDLARFLIAVPSRRGEAAAMRWEHVDPAGATWTMPGALTKNRDEHVLPLPPLALDILRARHEAAGRPRTGLVFPSPAKGMAIQTFSDIKQRIDAAVEGEPVVWTWHDFRRACVSALADAGVHEAVADALLNHRQSATRGGVLGVYQRAKRAPEQRVAMLRWDAIMAAAIAGRSGVVVPLARPA